MKPFAVFDAERLKHPNVGLYHFCLHLGEQLLHKSLADNQLELKLYAPKQARVYPQQTRYVNNYAFHKLWMPLVRKPAVWHGCHQLTPYLPDSKHIAKILTVHDLNFLYEKGADKQRKYLQLLQRNIDRSDSIVCISHFAENELRTHVRLNNKPVKVIYNGNNIRTEIVPQKPAVEGFTGNEPYLFSIAAISRKKHLHVLPHLLVNNQLHLVISGIVADKAYLSEIQAICRQLGVSHRVHFTGAVSEAEKYYLLKHCHAFCFPSVAEGFGLPVVEAMHFGKLIFSSQATSLPEIGGDAVRYFSSFEEDYLHHLGQTIPALQLSADEVKKVQDRSRFFSWQRAAEAYWQEYRNLAL